MKPAVPRIWLLPFPPRLYSSDYDLVVAVDFLGLGLGEADGRDLGLAVRDARDVRLDDRRGVESRDLLGHEDALLEAAVRELQAGHDVADGVDVRDAGVEALVGEDEAAVDADALLLEAEARGAGSAADGDQQHVGRDAWCRPRA